MSSHEPDAIEEIILLNHLREGIIPRQYDKLNLKCLNLLRDEVNNRIDKNVRRDHIGVL